MKHENQLAAKFTDNTSNKSRIASSTPCDKDMTLVVPEERESSSI